MSGDRPAEGDLTLDCVWRCGVCLAVCKDAAIAHGSDGLKVVRSRCSGCLVCVRVCPAGILKEDAFA